MNSDQEKVEEDFLRKLWPLLLEKGLKPNTDCQSKVVDFVQPGEMLEKFDFSLPEEPCTSEALLEFVEDSIDRSVRTGHKHYFNTLYQGIDKMALAGAYLTETMNVTAYTYEVAPVFSLMESKLVDKVGKELIGYAEPDGIFCPGGSAANFYGLNLARYHRFPEVKTKGMQGVPPCHIYTSELSHYSMKKGVALMGIGLDNLITIGCDTRGRMIVAELREAIQKSRAQGAIPLAVNVTSGTTVFGAYDPLEEIADLCHSEDIWVHVDGAWGGSVLLSDKLRSKVAGIQRADSITWDPHKMLGSMQQCSLFLTRHQNLLRDAHCANAAYLFQQDKIYDTCYDTGDKSVQCGRKVDALKLWIQWKARGRKALGARVERLFDLTKYITHRLKSTPGFKMVVDEPECTNVCFWYIPKRLRDKEETKEWWEEVSKVAPKIKGAMQQEGTMLVAYQQQGNLVNFFRHIIANHSSGKEEADFLLEEIVRLGENL